MALTRGTQRSQTPAAMTPKAPILPSPRKGRIDSQADRRAELKQKRLKLRVREPRRQAPRPTPDSCIRPPKLAWAATTLVFRVGCFRHDACLRQAEKRKQGQNGPRQDRQDR